MPDSRFLLKTSPPRLMRAIPVRSRLDQRWSEVCDRTAIVVGAPQGFGKTTLLAQWRRNWLEKGAYVAWAALDAQDERSRFVDLLLFALRAATGRDVFVSAALRSMLDESRELDALTALLAEVAALAKPTVVVLDDAHRMPQETLQALVPYLINNAPPNLQVLVGSRRPLELQLADLMASGRGATIDTNDLRLSLDESLTLLRGRLGDRLLLDDAVRLHDVAEGWPLGLQLATSTIERAPDLHAAIMELGARRGDMQRHFFESLLTRISAAERSFLTRIAVLEVLDPRVCGAITGCTDPLELLTRIAHESPILAETEDSGWMRMHSLARDYLLGQFDRLPTDERRDCHRRAAAWYVEHGQFRDAARHALAAGDEDFAVAHASHCLRDIAREGRLGEARDWVRRLPASTLERDVHLQLSVAWITAVGDHAEAVPELLERAAQHPDFDELCRAEAAIVAAASAIYRDRPGLLADALRDLEIPPAGLSPLHDVALANSRAVLALHEGSLQKVRQAWADIPVATWSVEPGMRLAFGYADSMIGTSWLLEGRPDKVKTFLQPRLELAEREHGRRSPVAGLLAGPLAAALCLLDQPASALEMLADRLDVIERSGWAEPIVYVYRTLAEAAMRMGQERRALDVLVALHEYAAKRDLPRMSVVSLAEQARLHALAGRADTATELVARITALRSRFEQNDYRLFVGYVDRTEAYARGYVHLAQSDFERAEACLGIASATPAGLRGNPQTLRARALRAYAAHQRGQPGAQDSLAEVSSLAALGGMRRYVIDAHPALSSMLATEPANPPLAAETKVPTAPVIDRPDVPHAGGLLTPKEAQILSLLAVGKANKEIARAMDIGEHTVKWHLKNVFFKLDAGSRKHAVDRARLLGLLPS